MANFRKVKLEISRLSGYGQYLVTANYKGKAIKAHTTDSEMYDYLEDDSNKVKHLQAKRSAYGLIVRTFENS